METPVQIGDAGLSFVGTDLHRPECVLATASGRLFVSDRRGGVTVIEPDGHQHRLGTSSLMPNGIALQRDGSFLVANLSPEGGVWRIGTDGTVLPWLMEVDGVKLPGVNFLQSDAEGRTWIGVSATHTGDHYPIDDATGYIILHHQGASRVIADGLRYTNEFRMSADGRFMYVVETFGRRLSRFRIASDGRLIERATVAEFDAGDIPDGMALDVEGGAWVVCVVSNRVYRITPDGKRHTLIDDSDPATLERIEAAYVSRTLTRPMLSAASGRRLKNITSIAFGGPDMRTAWMGCLGGNTLTRFRSPVAGLKPAHWHWA